MNDHNYFVFILQCSDGLYYTGVTNDLEVRLQQHNEATNPACFTYKRRPIVLKYYQRFDYIEHAIEWEKQLKGWCRKKKEALFKENWERIKILAQNKTPRQAQGDSD